MASFRWQVRHPGDFCHRHILPSPPGHTSTVDISSGDEKKACVSFPDSAVFPTRWVDLKGQPGEALERLAYFQRSRVVVTGHGKTGVWKAWPSGVLLALSWFSLPWRGGGAYEGPVLCLACCQPLQPPCSWARPGAWRGMCYMDECLHILITEALDRIQCSLSAGLGLSWTNNTDRNGSPLHPTSRCQRRVVLCLAFPSHHLFFGWTPESFFPSRVTASVPVSKGQLLPAVAVSLAHVIVITTLPGGCCYDA